MALTLTFAGATYSLAGSSTSVTVTIPANAIVVAYASQDEAALTTLTVSSSTVGLAWTQRAATNNTTTRAEIWTAVNGPSVLTSEQITNQLGATGRVPSLSVWYIEGGDPSVLTQTATNTGSGTGFTITPTSSTNAVFVGGCTIYSNQTATPDGNTTEDSDQPDGSGYGSWSGHRTAQGTGALAIGGTWTGAANWQAAAIAINELPVTNQAETAPATDVYAAFNDAPKATAFQPNAYQSNAFQIFAGSGAAPTTFSKDEVDTTLTSDSQAQASAKKQDESDTALTSDPQDRKLGATAIESDTALTSDPQGQATGKAQAESDTALTSDPQVAQAQAAAIQTDTALTSDPQAFTFDAGGATFTKDQSDTTLTSDPQAQGTVQSAIETDTVLASDAEAQQTAKAQAESDTALTSDPQVSQAQAAAVESDTTLTSDPQVQATGKAQAESDTALSSDPQASQAQATAVESDTALTADSSDAVVITAGTYAKDQADTALTSDASAELTAMASSEADTALTSDPQAQASAKAQVESDTVLASDSFASLTAKAGTETDTVLTLDSYAGQIAGNIQGASSETVLASDSAVAVSYQTASLEEACRAADAYAAQVYSLNLDQADGTVTQDAYAAVVATSTGITVTLVLDPTTVRVNQVCKVKVIVQNGGTDHLISGLIFDMTPGPASYSLAYASCPQPRFAQAPWQTPTTFFIPWGNLTPRDYLTLQASGTLTFDSSFVPFEAGIFTVSGTILTQSGTSATATAAVTVVPIG